MELQATHSVCAEVQKKGALWRKREAIGKNAEAAARMEGLRNPCGGDPPGACAYAGEYTAEDVGLYGIAEGEKRRHAVCAIWRVEIQASKSSVPAPGHYGDTAEYIRHPPPHGIDWPRQQRRNVFEPW